MSGLKKGDKVRCISTAPDWGTFSWTSAAGCDVGGVYTIEEICNTTGTSIRLEEDSFKFSLSSNNFELVTYKEETEVGYINGDIVEAQSTGEVFLYVGSMWYNLSSGSKEMRGRKAIKSVYGPITKLCNISGSGDLFKQAHLEAIPPF